MKKNQFDFKRANRFSMSAGDFEETVADDREIWDGIAWMVARGKEENLVGNGE